MKQNTHHHVVPSLKNSLSYTSTDGFNGEGAATMTTGGYVKSILKKRKMNRTLLLLLILLHSSISPVPPERNGNLSTRAILAFLNLIYLHRSRLLASLPTALTRYSYMVQRRCLLLPVHNFILQISVFTQHICFECTILLNLHILISPVKLITNTSWIIDLWVSVIKMFYAVKVIGLDEMI